MVRLLAILLLLVVGLGAIVVASVAAAIKLVGALVWIGLAFGAYLLWSRSRSRSP